MKKIESLNRFGLKISELNLIQGGLGEPTKGPAKTTWTYQNSESRPCDSTTVHTDDNGRATGTVVNNFCKN